jgi:hypothetical protein
MSDIIERLKKAAEDFEAMRTYSANDINSDCEPHYSDQIDMAEASQAAIDAAAEIERLRAALSAPPQTPLQDDSKPASNYNLGADIIAPPETPLQGDNQPRYTTKRLHDEIAKARAYGLELAAELIDSNVIMDTSAGKVLAPRQDGNRDGLHYAVAIRSLATSTEGRE